ncbi:uncharacterized protein P174DRAFT_515381 [Aspergillus novofumigatus IBT 16806]|uniref:Uncharacterized protein n=1 Tax=Aspergillus novofumigatus (strain IBT 16806) TaxID=1392255 RepID=A0A2I1BXZ2_ASPN1|nr:uncharacterized protein P174DRAFT_515381 [Aspergillus novofumigatus IBT 16806]PKX90245.1 hypothetical protein P174DRAFT_515381 [Aspergillus novofumigatus IBT 16806]
MNRSVTPADAKGSLPMWTGEQGLCEADDKLLKPRTRETIRSRWGSDSTTGLVFGNGKGTLLDGKHNNQRTDFLMAHDVRSLNDLELVKSRRQQGEDKWLRHLRSALSTIGTLATDITRRLDYTYYSLLEKIAALTSTFASFQELSDSASTIFDDFERETSVLDGDIRRQIGDLKDFQPQMRKVERLEERMRSGKKKADALGKRLEAIRNQIDLWEKREVEWQKRVGRRLRIFWVVVALSVLVFLVVLISQKSSAICVPGFESPVPVEMGDRRASALSIQLPEPASGEVWSRYHSGSESRPGCYRKSHSAPTPTSPTFNAMTTRASSDPLRKLDEL